MDRQFKYDISIILNVYSVYFKPVSTNRECDISDKLDLYHVTMFVALVHILIG